MGAGGKEGRTELMDDEEEEPEFWVGRVGGGGGVVMDLDAFWPVWLRQVIKREEKQGQ